MKNLPEENQQSKHTPEPWGDDMAKKRDGEGVRIALLGRDDWSRAKLCVNALAGMNPSAIKNVVAELDFCVGYIASCECTCDTRDGRNHLPRCKSHSATSSARAALAALRGE